MSGKRRRSSLDGTIAQAIKDLNTPPHLKERKLQLAESEDKTFQSIASSLEAEAKSRRVHDEIMIKKSRIDHILSALQSQFLPQALRAKLETELERLLLDNMESHGVSEAERVEELDNSTVAVVVNSKCNIGSQSISML